MLGKNIPREERRKYKRLDTIFPVEFQILDEQLNPVAAWHQGFSQDISKGGICLTINDISEKESLSLIPQKANLLLQIHSPFSDRCFLAYAKIAWMRKVKGSLFNQFVIGVNFTKIDVKEIARFFNYVLFKKVIWHVLQLLIIGVLLFLGLVISHNFRLNAKNLAIMQRYSQLLNQDLELRENYKILLDEKEKLSKILGDSNLEMEILKESIKKAENAKNKDITQLEQQLAEAKKNMIESEQDVIRIKELKEQLEGLKKLKDEDIDKLKKEVLSLQEKEGGLKKKLSETIAKESETKAGFSLVEQKRVVLDEKFKDQLYRWLKAHQSQRTSLIISFEGDYNLKDISYIYDQALSVIAYTLFGDYNKAKKGLDFFFSKAERTEGGGFYNAYYSKKGDVAEYIAHAGPNLWLGIAVLQYTNKTKDYAYISLARQIARWIMSLQDEEDGIIGGRRITWYSTEHNLDGFAFFNMFYELTKEKEYKDTADKILKWLEKYAYDNEPVPVNRGKGDSTIATDTYAWSIAALGPEHLRELKVDPDQILEFVMENCTVTAEFTNRFGKAINVSGFDFAKHQHIARGGVISCEWTAQMILSFDIMSDYYFLNGELSKATYYKNLSLKYLNELNKMIISSSSSFGQGDWCMPYASQENVDTGHGWRTPKGNRTGSVAATAYTIFAISKFNPLNFGNK